MRLVCRVAAWMLALAMIGVPVYAESGEAETPTLQERAFMGAFGETPEEIITSAMEIYSWFTISPLDVDPELSANGVWRVADEALCHVDVMMRLLDFVFSPEIVNDLLAYGPYTVIDGMLYGASGGRSIDPRIVDVTYEETEADETRIVYTVTVRYQEQPDGEAEEEALLFVREKLDGQWVFTDFPFFW